MAVARRQDSSPGVGLTSTSFEAARVGNVELGRAVKDKVIVTKPVSGTPATVRNNIYAKTNFFIKRSRDFIPGATLKTYWYFRFMQWIFLVYIALIPPLPFVPFYVGWPLALATGVIGMGWLVIFAQHAHVVRCTVRKVLSQPIFPNSDQEDESAVYKITVERVEGRFLAAQNSGVGVLATTKNSASEQLHVLNQTGARKVKQTAVCSILCLIFTVIALLVSAVVIAWRLAIDDRFFSRRYLSGVDLYWPWSS